ncbi:MAG: hypothetical protein ABIA76_01630 [Candidatus Diapherotrites archaeon]
MTEEIKISKKKVKLFFVLIAVLIAGMVLGNLFPLNAEETGIPIIEGNKLSDSDKNFMVGLANLQTDLILTKNDWCVANGGIWNESIESGELAVTPELAQQIQEAGGTVAENEGKLSVQAEVIRRDGCIFIKK